MNNLAEPVVTVLIAVVGVAMLTAIISRNSNTAGVLSAGGNAFSGILGTALSPVTGAVPRSAMAGNFGGGVPLSLGMGSPAGNFTY